VVSAFSSGISTCPVGGRVVYNPATGSVVLFAGEGSDGTDLADTWTWDGATWTQQFPPVSPHIRDSPAMAYDPATGTVVMFGGEGRNGGGAGNGGDIFSDTWVWNGRGATWTEEFPASSPSARRTSIVYDAHFGAIVLYGGDNAAGDCCDIYFNDTWTWTGKTWTQLFPASSPPARALPAVAYDAAIGQIVMFGGYDVPGQGLNDTWSWDGSSWAQRQTTFSPPGRWAAAVGYNPARCRALAAYEAAAGRGPAPLYAITASRSSLAVKYAQSG